MCMIVNLTFLRTVWQECFSFFLTIEICRSVDGKKPRKS